jgi:elongation factor G
VLGTSADGDGAIYVEAEVPTSELLHYAIDLRSLTGGRGSFSAHHDHYDPLPANLVDRLLPAG